ncbi:MAG: non-homologous end-joining DNA ligase [Alphaproteobacteria bacterium]
MKHVRKLDDEAAAVAGVRLSNPGKELWPKTRNTPAMTKLDLAKYYERLAERILLHIKGRPLSMVRAPDGITGNRFFQRHVLAGSAADFREIRVTGEKKPFLAADTAKALVALAQAGVLELHPWGCKPNGPETPGRLVFDLDPAPDVAFDRVVEAARELRERIAQAGLEPFVKTTGGKGLHVTTPIKASRGQLLTWDIAKNFALLLCQMMVQDSPNAYTTTLSKKARGGKIFLDYLRNDHFATAVAPYSPRAKEGAPVAMPLEWSKLRTGVNPKRFHVANASIWLKAGDPWRDLDRAAAPLGAAIKRIKQMK